MTPWLVLTVALLALAVGYALASTRAARSSGVRRPARAPVTDRRRRRDER